MNSSKPNSPAAIGCTTCRRHSCCAVRWSLSPHPGPPWGEYPFSPFSVAAGVPPAVEPGILHGGSSCGCRRQFRVQRCHSGRQDAVLYGSQDGRRYSRNAALNKYWGEGEPFSPRSINQTFRLLPCGARCSLSLRDRVRVRGNPYRTIPRTVGLDESCGEVGGFPE